MIEPPRPLSPFLTWFPLVPVEDVPPWGEPGRDEFLRNLAMGVDLLAIATAVMQQKLAGMAYSCDGPTRTATATRNFLQHINGSFSIWIQLFAGQFLWSDRGAYAQLVRYCPAWAVDENGVLTERGRNALEEGKDRNWEIADIQVLDSRRCTPTGDPQFPMVYQPTVGGPIKQRRHQFLHMIDSPIADATKPGYGLCAVSRCLDQARTRKAIAAYFRECLEGGPSSGVHLLRNVMKKDWEEVLRTAEAGMRERGNQYYRGPLVICGADASSEVGVVFVPFRIFPEGYDQREGYTEAKEIVAAAFGEDPLEFGAMPGQGLGSAEQSTTMMRKSSGKMLASLLQGIEREFADWVLPDRVEFRFVSHDVEEEREKAELAGAQITNVRAMFNGDNVQGVGLIDQAEARQLLADQEIIPAEFQEGQPDVTDREEISDTESEDGQSRGQETRQVKAPNHLRNLAAVNNYTAGLRRVYEEWSAQASREMANADEGDRDRKWTALLLLLATRMKAAGRSDLYRAFEENLEGAVPDSEVLAALEEAIAANDGYIDSSFIPAVRERFATAGQDLGAGIWNGETIQDILDSFSYRTELYGGTYWEVLGLAAGVRLVELYADPPVERFLDPEADHCATCPEKAREYPAFSIMVDEVGLPGDGSDQCNGNCRCGVRALIGDSWRYFL